MDIWVALNTYFHYNILIKMLDFLLCTVLVNFAVVLWRNVGREAMMESLSSRISVLRDLSVMRP